MRGEEEGWPRAGHEVKLCIASFMYATYAVTSQCPSCSPIIAVFELPSLGQLACPQFLVSWVARVLSCELGGVVWGFVELRGPPTGVGPTMSARNAEIEGSRASRVLLLPADIVSPECRACMDWRMWAAWSAGRGLDASALKEAISAPFRPSRHTYWRILVDGDCDATP